MSYFFPPLLRHLLPFGKPPTLREAATRLPGVYKPGNPTLVATTEGTSTDTCYPAGSALAVQVGGADQRSVLRNALAPPASCPSAFYFTLIFLIPLPLSF